MKTDFSDFTIYMIALGTLGAFRWLGEKSLTEALLMAAFFGLLYAAGQIDRKRGRLPDWCMGAAFLLGFCGLPFFDGILLPDRILGSFAVSLPLFVICLIRPGASGVSRGGVKKALCYHGGQSQNDPIQRHPALSRRKGTGCAPDHMGRQFSENLHDSVSLILVLPLHSYHAF